MKINPFQRAAPGQPGRPVAEEGGKPASGIRSLSLTPGQLLKARVVRVEGNGKVLLAIDEELVTARTPLELTEGSEHWLEVRQGGAEPWLVMAGRKGAAGDLLRLLAAEEAGRGKGLELFLTGSAGAQQESPAAASIRQDVAALLADSAVTDAPDPARIIFSLFLLQDVPGQKEGSGFLRRRLEDLLRVLPEGTAGRKEGEKLGRVLAAAAKMNSQPSTGGDRFLLFPCLLAGGAGWGEWLFTSEDSGGEAAGAEEAGYTLSFFLHLSRLGELHLQLAVRGEAVRGTFATANAKARRHLEGHLPELAGLFKRLGFEKVNLSCRPARGHLLHELRESLHRRAGSAPLALVDLQA